MTNSFIQSLTRSDWEPFCEKMLRQHYGARYFWKVPDEDGGDLGLEFYTVKGTIYQCYYPDPGIEMKEYKKRIQKKINDDLKKLKDNESEISKLLGGVIINQWVLLTPENKSKDFISYCHKKKNEVIAKNVSYINNKDFVVKIETAESFPDAMLYAQSVYGKAVNITLSEVTDNEMDIWKTDNSEFSNNISRKSDSLMGDSSNNFQNEVVTKYIQIEKFLDQLRVDYPDIHNLIEDSALAQLQVMKEGAVLEPELGIDFIKAVIEANKESFKKYSEYMSEHNVQSLSFGFLSKWLAECYMDFKK